MVGDILQQIEEQSEQRIECKETIHFFDLIEMPVSTGFPIIEIKFVSISHL